MNFLKNINYVLKIFSIKEDEALYKCLKNDIPLTDENILHMIEIIKQEKEMKKHKIPKKVVTLFKKGI